MSWTGSGHGVCHRRQGELVAKRKGRPKKKEAQKLNTQIGLRCRDDLVEMLDKKLAELCEELPEIQWNRADVARHMLYKAFKAENE
jgi:hypothetical protein